MFYKIFLEHPYSIKENYWQHLGNALKFSFTLFLTSLACLVHALIPCIFTTTTKSTLINLHDKVVVNRMNLSNKK